MADEQEKASVLRMVPKAAPAAAEPPKEPDEHAAKAALEGLLHNLLERVQAGWLPHMLVVHAVYEDNARPGAARHVYWSHHVANHLEHLGLLDLAKYSLLTESNPS
jgi:hypothetical protein